MNKTTLYNQFITNKSEESKIRYSTQTIYCVSQSRKTKKKLYSKPNEKSATAAGGVL